MNEILEFAGVVFAISASVALPPLLWLLAWRRSKSATRDLAREARLEERITHMESEMELMAAEVARTTEAHDFLAKVLAPDSPATTRAAGTLFGPR
jgi:hypothetical protein